MNIILATTWYPRGELTRFNRVLPILREMYGGMMISFGLGGDPEMIEQCTGLRLASLCTIW